MNGKGTIYLDDLKIEKLDPPSVPTSDPVVSFSDNKLTIAENQLFDNNPQTFWSGGEGINHFELNIDFTVQKEFGGIVTDWANNGFPAKYIFEGSNDKNNWTKLSESKGKSGKSYIVTPEARYRYLRLKIQNDKANELRLNDIVLKSSFGDNYNNLYYEIAAESPKGRFPRYTLRQQNYFTVVGVSGDVKEGLLNEDGLLETDKQSFSVEPFLHLNGKFVTWHDVEISHSLLDNYLPLPSVIWKGDGFDLKVLSFASGEPGSSILYSGYEITNTGDKDLSGNFFLAIRPFQVNPPWPLNFYGGTAKVETIEFKNDFVVVNNKTSVIPLF